jgi:DNA polymerase III alpha subunit (gram-positive type)
MSGGAVLNEAGQLVGIHVGLTKVGGDGEGVLISTFLQMAPPEVEEVLGSSTPDVLSSSSSENEGVELQLPSKEEKVSMEDENEIGVELPEQLDKERRKREEIEQRVQELEVERNKQRQLEKEKRQRQKAEWREERLEAERQREQTKIQREQCKQRRSQKEKQKQKKSELELEQKEKGEKQLVSWYVIAFLVCTVFIFGKIGLLLCKCVATGKKWEDVDVNELSALEVVFCVGWFISGIICSGSMLNIGLEAHTKYHEWINCNDAYPPKPFLFRLF